MIEAKDKRGRPRKYVLGHQHKRQDNELFWNKVNLNFGRDNKCWLWTGAKDSQGYGMITVTSVKKNRSLRAHRYAWQYIYENELPEGMKVLHICDEPSCVREDHLFLGTQDDNNKDRARKGRSAKGENHPKAKLTREIVSQIRRHYGYGYLSMSEIARRYRIHPSTVSQIVKGETWRERG